MPVDQRRASGSANLNSQMAQGRVCHGPKLRHVGEPSPLQRGLQRRKRRRVDLAGPGPAARLAGEVVIQPGESVRPDDQFTAAPWIGGVVLVADAVTQRPGGMRACWRVVEA
jgi:hypothetical protein